MYKRGQITCLTALCLLFSSLTVLGQTTGGSDSLRLLLDSLEVEILKTTKTYAQVDRLIQSIPLRMEYLDRLPSILPVAVSFREFIVTSPFGLRKHPIHKKSRFHGGIDVRVKKGIAVTATAPGIVKRVGYDPGLGAFVQVLHGFGFETIYGHLAGYCVQPGQQVNRGQEIGKVGQTGLATGPHLHYVVSKNGEPIDPLHFCFLLRRRLYLVQRPGGNTSSVSGSLGKD